MKAKQATYGATLIIVVLFTLLLMAVVLAATMRMGLTSRQNTGDQKATLQAQYAAESNFALIQSHLRDMQTLLSTRSIVVPPGTPQATARTWALNFCGIGASWEPTSEFRNPREGRDNTRYPSATQCNYTKSTDAGQFNVLTRIIPASAFAFLPERPTGTTSADMDAWWKSKLDNALAVGSGSYQITPLRVVQLDGNTYRFYMRTTGLAAKATDGSASRVLQGRAAQTGVWWFQIELPNLLKNVLMTNHHRSDPGSTYSPTTAPNIYFANAQTFDGDVFTNEKFLFDTTSQANFMGSISSAGCIDLPRVGEPTSTNRDCTHQAGVYTGTGNNNNLGATWDKDSQLPQDQVDSINSTLRQRVSDYTNNVRFNGIPNSPNFADQYKALPTNSTDQAGMGNNGGLVLASTHTGVRIYAGDSAGASFNGTNATYNTTTKKWVEPGPTYQYVEMLSSGTTADQDNRYRIDESGVIYKYDPETQTWPTFRTGFNGMIYSPSTSQINVYGPARLNGDTTGNLARSAPALASFSNMTITGSGGMRIKTDLTMSDTPCANSEVIAATCAKENPMPQNVLGLYSPTGNIDIDTTAPNNVNIHSAMLTSSGSIQVASFNNRVVRGTANIIGSVLENFYGPFGQFSGTTATSGYQRNFRWDPRFNQGITPRGFPVSPTWNSTDGRIANRNLSDVTWKQGSR